MGFGEWIGKVGGGTAGFFVGGPAGAKVGWDKGGKIGNDAESMISGGGGQAAPYVEPDWQNYSYGRGLYEPRFQPDGSVKNELTDAGKEALRIQGQQAGSYSMQGMESERAKGFDQTAAGYNAQAQAGLTAAQDPALQRQAYNRMMGLADSGPGPSAAEAQLRMGQDAAMAQTLAMARSGRGAGGQAQAMRQAQFQNAGLNQTTNAQASVLRAQEAAQWRQQQAQLYGQAGSLGTDIRGQDIDVAKTQGQMAGGYMDQAQQSRDRGLQYNQLAFNQEQQRQQIIYNQMQAQQAYEAQKSTNYLGSHGINAQQRQAQQAAMYSMMGTALGAGLMSDIRSKENIRMPKSQEFDRPDVRQPNYAALDQAYSGSPDFRQAKGYEYEYKPEFQGGNNGPGTYYGPMAQDLEQVPGVVQADPQTGMKSIDTGRLALANTAGISDQQRRLDELQAELEALRGGRSSYPQPSQPQMVMSDERSKQQIQQLQRENAYLKGKGALVPPPSYGERPSVAGVTVQPGYMAPGRGTRVPPPSYVNHVDLPEQQITGTSAPDPALQRQLEALRYAREQQPAGGV